MCCRLETVTVKHLVDEPLPQSAGLGVSLQGMLYREHMVEWHLFVVSEEEPVGVLMVDVDVGRLVGRRRVCISVGCVDFDTERSFVRTQSEEQPHARLFDA